VDTPTINVLSLFSGIGGLDLGVRLAIPDARTVCYVERELAACQIMGARMADGSLDDAPIFTDITAFDGRPWRGVVDLIIGGFPCQDLSVAGKRAGISGKRSGLWFEYVRIIREVEPRWVMVENVPPVLAFPAGHAVLRELAESGFDAEWVSVRASDVGAPHRRERVFVLAHRTSGGLRMLRESSECAGLIVEHAERT
jgi:DNA (cytosine-5)-methyltransferase 1